MSNSALSCKRLISPNRNSPRNHKIDTITIHCVVGQMGVDALCSEFSRESKGASDCKAAVLAKRIKEKL